MSSRSRRRRACIGSRSSRLPPRACTSSWKNRSPPRWRTPTPSSRPAGARRPAADGIQEALCPGLRLDQGAGSRAGSPRVVSYRFQQFGRIEKDWFWDEADGGGPLVEHACHALRRPRLVPRGAGAGLRRNRQLLSPGSRPGRGSGCGHDPVRLRGNRHPGRRHERRRPWRPARSGRGVTMVCDRGVAEVRGWRDTPYLARMQSFSSPAILERRFEGGHGFAEEFVDFIACVEQGRPPRVGGVDGRRALQLVWRSRSPDAPMRRLRLPAPRRLHERKGVRVAKWSLQRHFASSLGSVCKDARPEAGGAPEPVPLVGRLPLAVFRRHRAPRGAGAHHPQDAGEHGPVVVARPPRRRLLRREQRLRRGATRRRSAPPRPLRAAVRRGRVAGSPGGARAARRGSGRRPPGGPGATATSRAGTAAAPRLRPWRAPAGAPPAP